MAVFDNSYSRMVAWLKIMLPLAALVILSTLFLVSRPVDPTLSLPFADQRIRSLAEKPRIGSPEFSAVTPNGSAINMNAEVMLPLIGEQTGFKASKINGTFETPDGLIVQLSAQSGIFDNTAQTVSLGDGVILTTSSGYHIETNQILADMNESRISTGGSISAQGPFGLISAGQMVLQQISAQGSEAYELVFKNEVKLVYVPKNNRNLR
ncbi:MAG: hypothetical protein ACU0C9_04615 [Paracoccaceae bacterium]